MHELQLIASAIATQEGYFVAGTIPATLNNPGDLIASPLPRNKVHGKVQFLSIQEGITAIYVQLCLYALRGQTLRQAIANWAPGGVDANNPGVYLKNVLIWTGLDPDKQLWDYLTITNVVSVSYSLQQHAHPTT